MQEYLKEREKKKKKKREIIFVALTLKISEKNN